MTQSELAAALQRRQQNRKNLKRYVHTRSFNELAGRETAPGRDRPRGSCVPARIVFALCAVGFFLVGLYYAIF